MPCYQVNLLSVELKAADRALLSKALVKLGFQHVVAGNALIITVPRKGVITISGEVARLPSTLQDSLNQIKVAYSEQVIEAAANEYNWTISEEDEQIVLRRYS